MPRRLYSCGFFQFLRRKELDGYYYTLDKIVVHQNMTPPIPPMIADTVFTPVSVCLPLNR